MTAVLHVTDASFAGVLTAVTDLARMQAELPGARIALAYVPRPDSPPQDRIQELAGERVRVHRLTGDARLAVPALLARLGGVIGREDPQIIHLHSSRAGMIGRAVGLVRGQRRRIVYSPHGFAFERAVSSERMRSVYGGLERLGARMAPALALCSPSEEALARRRVPRARTTVLANAVDVDRLQRVAAAAPRRSPADPLRIVHVGRISEQKLAPAFGRIATSWAADPPRPARFIWIGDGDRSLLPEDIEITGWLEHDDLLAELARADLMLFTTAAEAMPMALLEAQALGVPVVGSRATGVVDVVEDGVTGRLGSDEDELASALAHLAVSEEERRRLAAAAIRRIRERFTMETLARRSLDAYDALGIRISEGNR